MVRPFYHNPVIFIFIHCFVWWLMALGAYSMLDGYGDMVEVYAWSQHWLMGSNKHPQFLPWMAKLWFMIAPKSVASFFLLSAINLAVAFLGILALGRALRLTQMQIMVALALTTMAFPYLTLNGKLNMNAICLSTWPWVSWAFVRVVDGQARRPILYAIAFGVLAAISMMSKYYSVVLLIPLFVYSLLPRQIAIWKTVAPWIALLTFLLATFPHLYWLYRHPDAVLYAEQQGDAGDFGRAIYYIVKFIFSPFIYWPVPIILALIFFVGGGFIERVRKSFGFPKSGNAGALVACAAGPLLTTLGFSAFGFAELSMPWAIPIGFAFTLFLAANMDADLLERHGPKLIDAFRFLWPAMIIIGIALGFVLGLLGVNKHYRPHEEATQAVIEYWQQHHEQPLKWVATGNDAAIIAFFSPEEIEALPSLPNRLPDYYPPRIGWEGEAGLVVCSIAPAGTVNEKCLDGIEAWAKTNGLNAEKTVKTVKRTGWRFPKDVPFDIAVVYVWP